MKIKKAIIREYFKCDFCDKDSETDTVYSCSKCRKDICDEHIGQSTEDGLLCSECSRRYEIYEHPEGGVGMKDLQTGKDVKW